jgi:hypothetical protein
MQSSPSMKKRLKALFDAIEGEAQRNPAFAAELAAVFEEAPPISGQKSRPPSKRSKAQVTIPDVMAKLQELGEEEFRFWLRTVDLPTLKAIVKQNGFDPAKASQRWKEPDKFIALIHEQTQTRLKRGSAFLTPKSDSPASDS